MPPEPSPKSTPQKKRSRYDLSIFSKPPAFACSRSQALKNNNNSANSSQQPGYVPGRPMSQNQSFQLVNTPIYNQGGSIMNLSLTDANTFSLKKDLECAMGETLRQLMTALERLQQMRGAVEKDATKRAGILQSDQLQANIEALVRQHAVLPMQAFAEETRVHIKEEMSSIQSEVKKMSKNGEQLHADTASTLQTLSQQQEALRSTINTFPERLASMEALITQRTAALQSETKALSNTISQLVAQFERQTTTLNRIIERNDYIERKMQALEECSHQQADAVRALLETTKTEICETVRQSIESNERNAEAQAEKLKQAVLVAIGEMAYRPPAETPMKDELPSVDVAGGQVFPPITPLTIRKIVMNENWDAALENAHIPLQQAPRTPRYTLQRHSTFRGRRPSPASSPREISEVVIIDAFEDSSKENRGQSHELEQRCHVTVLGDSTVKNGVLNRTVTQARGEAGRLPVEEVDHTGNEANTGSENKKRKSDDPASPSTSSANTPSTLDTSQRVKPQRKRAKPQRYRDLVFGDF
ncbi:hypothetical protein HDU85_003686 [Gaertneriomyces sp. JEL0708]|nr:hypothetical protein HDU85_003686 [Gaertneriomyces sp. JEL0708]